MEWTLWDRFDVDEGRDITLKEFIDLFKERYKLEVTMISSGVSILYSFFTNQKKLKERMPADDVAARARGLQGRVQAQAEVPHLRDLLQRHERGRRREEEDVEVPYVRYRFAF